MDLRFPQEEKLKSRRLIERLFSEGKSISKFPVKLYFLPVDNVEKNRAAFAVPKRSFKLAVDRNRVKRQMREAYRHHKHMLSQQNEAKFALLFLYIGKEKPQYSQLESAFHGLLSKSLS
ncbi:MAG: ribonuclease P protein component [Bacteroidota bacterium]